MDGFEFQFLTKGVEFFGLQLCTLNGGVRGLL
jgi:hypothetical protein